MADDVATRAHKDNKSILKKWKKVGKYQDVPLHCVPGRMRMVVTEPAVSKAEQVERVRSYLVERGPVTFNEKKTSTATPTLIVGAGAVPDFAALLTKGWFDFRHHAADKGSKEERSAKRKASVTYELNRVSAKMKELHRSRLSADHRALSSVDVNTTSGTSSWSERKRT